MSEAEVLRGARLYLGQQPDVVVWRNQVGQATYPDREARMTKVDYGLCVGSSDLVAVLKPAGRFLAFECKSATGRPDEDQVRFLNLVRRMGGFAAILSMPEHAAVALAAAREGAFHWSPRVYRVGELAFP